MTTKTRKESSLGAEKRARPFGGRRPIVVKVRPAKKKRRYTKGLEDVQVAFRQATKMTAHVTNAVSGGIGRFEKKSNQSSRKHKDGVIVDLAPNIVSGMSTGLRRSAALPGLAVEVLGKPTLGQRILNGLRRMFRRFGGR